MAIQERIDAHLVEVGKSKGMEWKVSENMPVYACGNGVDLSLYTSDAADDLTRVDLHGPLVQQQQTRCISYC